MAHSKNRDNVYLPRSITMIIPTKVIANDIVERYRYSALPILGRFNKASTASLGRFKRNQSQAWGDHDDKQYGNGRQETHWPPTVVVVIKPLDESFLDFSIYIADE